MRLRLDAGRPLFQRNAFERRAAFEPKRVERAVDAAGDFLGRVGIDDDDGFLKAMTIPLSA